MRSLSACLLLMAADAAVGYNNGHSGAPFEFGGNKGDAHPQGCDNCDLGLVSVNPAMPFYGASYDTLFVNMNGVISFGSAFSARSHFDESLPTTTPFFAPFYADWKATETGEIYAGTRLQPADLATFNALIQSAGYTGFTATWSLLATWDEVPAADLDASRTNSMQAVVATDGSDSMAVVCYGRLDWPRPGDADHSTHVQALVRQPSRPHPIVVSRPLQIGFNRGNSVDSAIVATLSATENAYLMAELSNFGQPGCFVFDVTSQGSLESSVGNLNPSLCDPIDNIDECETDPCEHGDCFDRKDAFECDCDDGWFGPTCSVSASNPSDWVFADTEHGRVVGLLMDGAAVFRGIPYAAPPVGQLQFAAPEPPASWPNTDDDAWPAFAFSRACTQFPIFGDAVKAHEPASTDCLYLNVFAPQGASGLPVLVWFHPGENVVFSGAFAGNAPATIASQREIVIVTFNWRLGPFGYASDGSTKNAGMRDQIMVLNWVHNNIANFGGDNERVTLAGDGQSAAVIDFFSMFPQTESLFQQCIQIGGGWAMPSAFADMQANSATLLSSLGCSDFCCVSGAISGARFIDVTVKLPTQDLLNFGWALDASDDEYFWTDVHSMMAASTPKVGILAHQQYEAALFTASNFTMNVPDSLDAKPDADLSRADVNALIAQGFARYLASVGVDTDTWTEAQYTAMLQLLEHYYHDPRERRDRLQVAGKLVIVYTRMLSDVYYFVPSVIKLYDPQLGTVHSGTKQWAAVLKYAPTGMWGAGSFITGATFTNLVRDFFDTEFIFDFVASTEDLAMRSEIQKYFTTFVKFGDPWAADTRKDAPKVAKWLATNDKKRGYLGIDRPKSKPKKLFGQMQKLLYMDLLAEVRQLDDADIEKAMKKFFKRIDKALKKAKKTKVLP